MTGLAKARGSGYTDKRSQRIPRVVRADNTYLRDRYQAGWDASLARETNIYARHECAVTVCLS
jgi:hypothetical protein